MTDERRVPKLRALNDLYAATAFKVAGRSSLAQANRTAKQMLNHCNSDIKEPWNVAMTVKVIGSSSNVRIFNPFV